MRSNLSETTATPPPVPLSRPQLNGVNRVLGATAGPTAGNTRSILAVLAITFAHAIFTLLLVAYFMGDATRLEQFILITGGALFAFDFNAGTYYFGKRSGEGA